MTDIVGVILLFIYGLPSKIIGPPKMLLEGDITNDELKKNAFVTKMSYLGLTLLIIGFILQLAGVWANYFCK